MSEVLLAWLAVISAGLLIIERGVRVILGRRKESQQIDEALEKQPLVKEQLELGNIRGAVEVLNQIITTQGEQLVNRDNRISHLEERESALEAEVSGYQNRYSELQGRYEELQDKYLVQSRIIERMQERVLKLEQSA